jgi:hypothetical protein
MLKNMDLEKLKKLIELGYSVSQLSKELKKGKTTIRYWLRKENLKTHAKSNMQNENKKCIVCSAYLIGNRLKFCSNNCKSKFFYKNNNSYLRQQIKGTERKYFLIKKMGGKCSKCGYNKNLSAFDFHHKDRNEKEIKLDKRTLSNTSWEKIIAESKKCDLLCSNCHREIHNPETDMSEVKKLISRKKCK